tara:strand:+ start:2363 stop:2683 length:321 start_codon:yes stop_codon:yes gene_type:complete
MIIRIYESGKLDLETVGDMLWQADAQANFHPDARWINSSSFGTAHKGRIYREFLVRWIGREAIIMWLTSNQILFEVVSFDILQEEEEAIEGTLSGRDFTQQLTHMN